MSDLFNNTSNDYINPSLPQCPGDSDTTTFEFLPNRQVGIISGNSTLLSMNLADISQVVTAYTHQQQLIQSGEVVFVQGLTKGISYRTQYYLIDGSVAYYGDTDYEYMSVDLSVNFYKNFRYYEKAVKATADVSNGIDVVSALNIALDAAGATITTTYDASYFIFTGNTAGYSFNITAMDVSRWVPDTSTVGNSIYEDASLAIPAFKYPNTGMLGYLLKITYPSTAADEDSYININHVPDTLVYYEASTGNTNSYVRYSKTVDVGLNGSSSSTTMSAGDYLNYIDSNYKWEKVGVLRCWLTAEDPTSSNEENLITGFYLYNPQSFAVQVEYMTIL